jgi:hypothetical protein
MKRILLLTLLLVVGFFAKATPPDEGMWLPMFVERMNYADMKEHGLKLTPKEIYDINNSSLKDAIVMLGRGFCTAEMVSDQGLVLTNHHCAYDMIQSHSSVENDYLTDGFWAMKKEDELPNPGITASYLQSMEDVTEKVLKDVTDEMTETERAETIGKAMKMLRDEKSEEGKYTVNIRSFYGGNEYYLFIYKTYKDVRLVGAPPSAVGKFGGDTDNWMWPRHTGDFSVLRVYAGADNEPADYSKDNKPYKPKHFLPISLKGVKKDDYAMVMGYPGSTNRYLSSYGITRELEKNQPSVVKIRGERLAILKEDMDADKAVQIKYASKYAGISNYWKYFIGQQAGLKRLKVYDKKKAQEDAFAEWVSEDDARKKEYGEALKMLDEGFSEYSDYTLAQVYRREAGFGSEILRFAFSFRPLIAELSKDSVNQERVNKIAKSIKGRATDHFKNYNASTDKKVTAKLLSMYAEDVSASQLPSFLKVAKAKYTGNFEKFAEKLFKKSFLDNEAEVMAFLNAPNKKTLMKDPAIIAFNSLMENGRMLSEKTTALQDKLVKGNRLYIDGMRKMNPDKKYYPNANSTMRLSYGNVLPYSPKDGVKYEFTTTADGILQKEIPNDDEFHVPAKLKKLLVDKDYGQYANKEGKLVTCFITNNDITGGNSGSPVINAKGELIGLAFDGNWEAMSGDIAFEPELQRCINVDIRYVLFIIDKYAGAKHLIEEMKIIK